MATEVVFPVSLLFVSGVCLVPSLCVPDRQDETIKLLRQYTSAKEDCARGCLSCFHVNAWFHSNFPPTAKYVLQIFHCVCDPCESFSMVLESETHGSAV